MPAQPTPPPQPTPEIPKTTVVAKWSKKKQFNRDEIMDIFKKFGDIDLVMLKDVRDSSKRRPSALISFRLASSAVSTFFYYFLLNFVCIFILFVVYLVLIYS